MKITIDLPDEVYLKAKILAAERSMTFKDVVIQGLKLVTQIPPEAGVKKRKAELKRLLKAMQAGHAEPMVPLKREEICDRRGVSGFEGFQLSQGNATIIAAAVELGCPTVYSEDMSDGQDDGGVRVVNPFR